MTSVGSILREQREHQGRTIADIAEQLCITQQYLRSIEENDLTGVPGLFFYKSFARQYAAILGVDPARIRPALDALSEPEDPQPHPEIRVPNRLVQATNRRHIPDVPLGWSVVGLLIVLLGCSGFYAWWKRTPEPVRAAAARPAAPIVAVKAAAAPVTQPEQQIPIDATGGVVLKLSATERTWLSVSSDGKEIFSGVLQPSESKTLTGLDRATMKVGNAGGIEVRWNGKVLAPLGTRGQVLTIRLTPEDYEIVPPPAPKQEL
jgi:transcriptional regulator with XRE-family HTH domain